MSVLGWCCVCVYVCVCVCVCVCLCVCVYERKESPLFEKLLKKVSLTGAA